MSNITLHHLERSRSIRILWLLEETGVPYRAVGYRRDAQTMGAPAALKAVHPLGKSPVLEIGGKVMAESGAMVEYLIARHAPQLAPAADSANYAEYLQWLHFAESSAMFPLLFKLYGQRTALPPLEALGDSRMAEVFGYLEQHLDGRDYMVGNRLTGADFMVMFLADAMAIVGAAQRYPNLARYGANLAKLPSLQRAHEIELRCQSCTTGDVLIDKA